MKKNLFLLLGLLMSFNVMAQTKTITGTVVDATNEPVIGASVVEAGTTNGTITDLDGKFSLNVSQGAKINVSYIGYKTQTITTGVQNSYQIVLKEDTEVLDEVVVTGYGGSQKRATLTTAISKMDNSVLEKAAYSNAAQALQGSVTGLRVVTVSGQPGSEPSITLRGGATITGANNKALIIVDGVVRDSMGDINSSDIESIQVLKDAASTAIYGARANGGVILIETKSGKAGKASVNYKFKMGVNFARKGYDYLNAEDYIYYNRIGYKKVKGYDGLDAQQGYGIGNNMYDIRYLNDETAHLQNEGWQTMDDPVNPGKKIIFKDYGGLLDNDVFDDNAFMQEHYISITGGNDKGTFATILGYYNEDGQIIGTGYKRFNGSVNGSYKVFPFLNVKAGATYTWASKPSLWISEDQMFYRTRSQRPTWNPYDEEGNPASGGGTSDGNPAYFRDKLTQHNGERRQSYNIGFDLDILPKKLVLSGNASLLHYDYQREKFNKSYKLQSSSTATNTRQAEAWIKRYNQMQFNSTLTYTDRFAEKHNVDVMLGGEYYNYDEFQFEAKTQNSPIDDIPTLNVGAKQTYTSTTRTAYRILSGFGRINYNYDMKYLFSFVARYDGISRLKDNRWGFFPGISVGWNVMEENFWKDSKISEVISNLKPRISYGVNGNVNGIGNFDVYGAYGLVDAKNYGGSSAFYNSALVNTGLRWEQSKTLEVGLDIGFFNNKLSFIIDYFNRRTNDLLTKQALPGYLGFSDIMTNMGTLRNSGIELEVKANILNNVGGFTWDLSANLSSVANKIISLPYNGIENNRVGGYEVAVGKGTNATKWIAGRQEGGKLGEMVAYKQNHIFKSWDDVKEHANMMIDEVANLYGPGLASEYAGKEGWKPIEPGDVCWEDINGDNKINGLDREVVGNIFPKVTGGFSSTLSWKGISLYARFDYALGHTLYNDLAARTLGQYQGAFNIITEVKDMWSEDNPNSDLPAFYYADQLAKKNITRSNNASASRHNNSSRLYEKADYLALRELTLSWDLPKAWTSKAFIQNASVYVTGQNLFYVTGYTGTSPEPVLTNSDNNENLYGVDQGRYPTPRTVLFGLSVTF